MNNQETPACSDDLLPPSPPAADSLSGEKQRLAPAEVEELEAERERLMSLRARFAVMQDTEIWDHLWNAGMSVCKAIDALRRCSSTGGSEGAEQRRESL